MKKRTRLKRHRSARGNRPTTDVRTVEDLNSVLAEMASKLSYDAVANLRTILLEVQKQFDPQSVTMTSTNIPDAIEKLSAVLHETNEATAKVFRVVERQHGLLREGELILNELEKKARKGGVASEDVSRLVGECRLVHEGIQSTGHQVVLAQEFQDLTGQKIRKVIKVVEDLDVKLRALLTYFRVEIPCACAGAEVDEDKDIDQAAADAMLKDLGI